MKKFLKISLALSVFVLFAFTFSGNANAQVINNVTSGYGGGFGVSPYGGNMGNPYGSMGVNNVTSGYGGGYNPYANTNSFGSNYGGGFGSQYGYMGNTGCMTGGCNIFGVSNGMPAGYGTSPYGQFAAMTPYFPQTYSTMYSPYSQFGSGFNSYNPSMYSPYSGSNYGSGYGSNYGGGYNNLNLGLGLGLQTGRYY